MSNAIFNAQQTRGFARVLARPLTGLAVHLATMVGRRMQRARTKKILHSLSDEQLRDVGIDRLLIEKVWQIKIDPRLVSMLMSLR